MAIPIAQIRPLFPSASPITTAPPKSTTILLKHAPKFPQFASNRRRQFTSVPKASADDENAAAAESAEERKEMTELGKEIQQAMKEREQEKEKEKESGFVSGVIEEIREIEWPAFGKVLGTTGVVLGVIAGSSLVLLTVNAVLAEISDTVFAGKGVQDFFG
ncbi:preprotein translocase subunit SECE1 [Salvia hispanica]|uniref:preprotein translocase subunit SECE1 n=1 Tax=Salvia hispanica TaxID=49212 RepID=UPI0020092205|nr:preprotein translocase subunit SECE1 [Salvia hispanica]